MYTFAKMGAGRVCDVWVCGIAGGSDLGELGDRWGVIIVGWESGWTWSLLRVYSCGRSHGKIISSAFTAVDVDTMRKFHKVHGSRDRTR